MQDAANRRLFAPVCAFVVSVASLAGCGSAGGELTSNVGSQPTLDGNGTTHDGAPAPAPTHLPMLRGVNLAGAEFGQALPGTYGATYVYPSIDEAGHWLDMGMSVIRLPFMWERLQHELGGELDSQELYRLDTLVSYITSRGGYVLLDPHNYARYYGAVIGESVPAEGFAQFWGRLADLYKDDSHVIFGLMNEPNSMATETWVNDANLAIASIRETGARNLILVPGNAWTGAWSWMSDSYGTANGTALLNLVDPADNYAIEVHQYLDENSSGANMANCMSTTIGSERLQAFTGWLAEHGLKGFLGEFAGGTSSTCLAAIEDTVSFVESHPEQWLGWTYWAAGPWWGSSVGNIEPVNGQDMPQTEVLQKFL